MTITADALVPEQLWQAIGPRLGRHRYVVERSLAWLVGYRRLQVRYERRADIVLGFLHLACALICLKSVHQSKAWPLSAAGIDAMSSCQRHRLAPGGALREAAVMATRLESLVVDAADPRALARWWADALGWAVTAQEPHQVAVEPPTPNGLGVPLVFVAVADPKVGKNRVHLDLPSASADHQAAQVARLVGLGARPADVGQRGVAWVVLADPEGNEFCVLTPR